MTDLTSQLLKLINEGKTLNEISEVMNISNKKIFNLLTMIRNKGFEFDRKYYYNGDIIYVPKTSFITENIIGTNIITSPNDNNFEALVISDLHIGNNEERIDLLNMAYDYCVKEGIHIIIVCGDIIDGMYGRFPKIHDNIHAQIDYAIQNYPFDKSILNFATLGDHDYDAMKNYGQNIARVFESYRHDIIPLGYCNGQINVKNDKIIVRHPSDKFDEFKSESMNRCLSLNGHSHKMKISTSTNDTTINIPTLSGLTCNTELPIPSAVRMNLEFKNGMIWNGIFSQLIFTDKGIYRVNEYQCYILGYGKDVSGNKEIKLEEDRTKKKVLELPKPEKPMSQIEKFNTRYGFK